MADQTQRTLASPALSRYGRPMAYGDTDLRLSLSVSPHGHLVLGTFEDAPAIDQEIADRLRMAFARGAGHGILMLGVAEVGQVLPPVFSYFRELGSRFVTALCTQPTTENKTPECPPPPPDLAMMAIAAPPIPGLEYLTAEVLTGLWNEVEKAFTEAFIASNKTLQDFLNDLNPIWNVVGRVHFNLAENRKDEETPFAFLATYTDRLSSHGKAQHLPLGQALRAYSSKTDRKKLLSLLLPVHRAAERCAWLKEMLDAGEIFHPVRFSAQDAFHFLADAPELEKAGVVLRMPTHWKMGRPPRPTVTGTVGAEPPSTFGAGALMDFRMEMTLDGQQLTKAEVKEILAQSHGLALIRGQWVEVDRQRIERMMARFQEAEAMAAKGAFSFVEAMRMLSGAEITQSASRTDSDFSWSQVVAGDWLATTLQQLRTPDGSSQVDPGQDLRGTLRPYQKTGVQWLHLLSRIGLGSCLADDMGLGKTIQVLSLLLVLRREQGDAKRPSLLVAPASLLGNWADEITRFAPGLTFLVAHTSEMAAAKVKDLAPETIASVDLIITTYGSVLRNLWMENTQWNLVILDEAQAIKNPSAKQTRAVKKLRSQGRIALTGTPVENRLGDLWSLFDFINPGLLGSAKEFTQYTKRLSGQPKNPYAPLRDLVRPYILRRLKTDRSVISDLPDKTEVKAFCQLSRKQVVLYQQAVQDLARQLEEAEGIERRGIVLAFLMRFKQICNHPSQWLGDASWAEIDSGKWSRLREICNVIASKQEKVLIFTQFREITAPLAAFLGGIFGRPGLVLHGGTAIQERKVLVQKFQDDESIPFFILSLKAGGSGLNLTAASHVIHFDRWWNPAVENQATDRAFRIGQKKNVLVHKFVCSGTIEDKIDELIASKQQLSADLLEGGAELNLTEMNNEDLLRIVSLDINAAMKE